LKVLLVNPPFYRLLGSHYNANSLGIAYIASVLNNAGHDAWLYNADFLNEVSYKTAQNIIKSNLVDNKFTDYTDYFNDLTHPMWDEITDKILDFKPDWVGYTSYTANITTIDIISTKVSERDNSIKQVIGGVHATLDYNVLDSVSNIDYCIRREGEYSMLSLVNGEDPMTIQGVTYRPPTGEIKYSGDSEVIKDIDTLPFPERKKFWGLTDEEKRTVDVSYICTIRGCPYRCNYCASPFHWKRDKTQYRSPESVIAEIKELKNNYWDTNKEYDYSASANTFTKDKLKIKDNTIVYFVDDVFTIKKERVKEILKGMIDEKLNLRWKCEARTDHLDIEMCKLMKKAGCERIKLGFESGSDRILKQIQKDETIDDMLKGVEILKEAKVPFTAYFMAGFPGETDKDLKQTIELAKKIDADYYSISVVSPYYGTKMYYTLMDDGYKLDKEPWEYFFHGTGKMIANSTITKEVLDEYLSLNELNNKIKGYV